MNERKEIRQRLCEISCYKLNGDIEDVIGCLQEIQQKYSNHDKIYLDAELHNGYGVYTIYGYIMETQAQADARVRDEESDKIAVQQAKRRQLEQLKKELGDA